MTEADLQAAVLEYAQLTGWLTYHTHDSRRSAAGWPDLAMVRGDRLVFAELKSETGTVTAPQSAWLHALQTAGQEVHLWRPANWPADIEEALRR